MKIIYKTAFERQLIQIIDYIAQDKKSASFKFAYELEKSILSILDNPFKYKQSLYFNDKNIRDMTYKTYTLIYEINFEKDSIEILKIFNKNKPS
ncbi:MAG: type II toxin-antitoxin system RelE/ParE family toxin [Campylobacterales bacterium]|nr:type II toxin-antitoxin system RelE/ParE family toxin [Campylobacterales bacterium]